ncbi:hypothetical protein CQA38_00395 [Campylobacter sp. MIT 12-5580]|uniref:TFIIB-type zinc ribbon-containing protein n=1 Tax=Campylobacter sp. MIT 12-5580 TaxID=2040651 RepID=UPI0010F774A3|nr:zf-TFIIB domain-containing protein [Campylobacter sp. MIT 12-5580]TKX30135.1 hypothetical protein CQA38_00395 [Campylobacter sp. MIT 12-5580]
MLCPVCNGVDLIMSERNGVEIDYCPKCRGVWLDRGELDKIIERNGAQTQHNHNPQNYNQNYNNNYQHGSYHKKKKESWLGELFDF